MRLAWIAGSTLEASVLAARLEAEGIRVRLNGVGGTAFYAGDGPVAILVEDEDADRAARLLKREEDPSPQVESSRARARQALGSLVWALYVTPPALILLSRLPWEAARLIGACALAALALGALGLSLRKLMKG